MPTRRPTARARPNRSRAAGRCSAPHRATSRRATPRTSWPIPSSASPNPRAPRRSTSASATSPFASRPSPEHGMATIWDADVLIWAASQIVEARDRGQRTSRLMATTPYEILTFVGRGTRVRDYQRLKAALDRLQATTVATIHRQPTERRRHRFSWINEWKETRRCAGPSAGRRTDPARLVLRRGPGRRAGAHHRPGVFRADRRIGALALSPGAQARRPAGGGWSFDFRHLHAKSGASRRSSTSPSTARHRPPPAAAGLHASLPKRRPAGASCWRSNP